MVSLPGVWERGGGPGGGRIEDPSGCAGCDLRAGAQKLDL